MLKFIKHNMENIIGIEIFPVIAFVIFFCFFIGLLIYVARMKKANVETLSGLPFDDGIDTTDLKTTRNEN